MCSSIVAAARARGRRIVVMLLPPEPPELRWVSNSSTSDRLAWPSRLRWPCRPPWLSRHHHRHQQLFPQLRRRVLTCSDCCYHQDPCRRRVSQHHHRHYRRIYRLLQLPLSTKPHSHSSQAQLVDKHNINLLLLLLLDSASVDAPRAFKTVMRWQSSHSSLHRRSLPLRRHHHIPSAKGFHWHLPRVLEDSITSNSHRMKK